MKGEEGLGPVEAFLVVSSGGLKLEGIGALGRAPSAFLDV